MRNFFIVSVLILSSTLNAQMYKRGDIILSAGIGFPNLYTWTTNDYGFYFNDEVGNEMYLKFKANKNPISQIFCLELMKDKRLSHGFEFSYVHNFVSTSFSEPIYELKYDSFSNDSINEKVGAKDHEVSFKNSKYNFVYNLSFHFSRNRKRFDGYITSGLGLSYRKTTGYKEDGLNFSKSPYRLALRFGLGMNYFLTKNIGLNLTFRLGGPLVSTGLTLKF